MALLLTVLTSAGVLLYQCMQMQVCVNHLIDDQDVRGQAPHEEGSTLDEPSEADECTVSVHAGRGAASDHV